jgi:hypothetical protein
MTATRVPRRSSLLSIIAAAIASATVVDKKLLRKYIDAVVSHVKNKTKAAELINAAKIRMLVWDKRGI